jgi:GNAT superfamily N-acetyltransferase
MSGDAGASGDAGTRKAFQIRPATPEDEPSLLEIQHSSAIHHATIDPDRWQEQSLDEADRARRHWHRKLPRSEGLVAVADGRVVGMIELWLKRPRGAGARTRRLKVDLGLAVAPEWRGRGVGSALMLAAEDWARAQGAERMVLDLAANNSGAQRLYERLGYEVEPRVTMSRWLRPR